MTAEIGDQVFSGTTSEQYAGSRLANEYSSPIPTAAEDAKDLKANDDTLHDRSSNNVEKNLNGIENNELVKPAKYSEVSEDISLDRPDEVPGYEPSASICVNRARQIARSLNHMNISADHLMLALTMDQSARRLLERVGDVTQLREAAMQRLGHFGAARDSSEQFSIPTSDLADIAKSARDAANEREQSVAISDLINAFPKLNGRLSYGAGENLRAAVLMEKIESGLVPRVADSMNRIETIVSEAVQRGQTVQNMLQDLNSRQSYEAEQRQLAFLEDIRRQVREAVGTQVSTALQDFSEALVRKLDELKQVKEAEVDARDVIDGDPVGVQPAPTPSEPVEAPKEKPNNWNWLALI